MSSFTPIRQRKLAQWALAYLAAAWVLLQVLGFVAESFEWPPQVARMATVLAAAGFVAVLVLAWYHGERGRQTASAAEVAILGLVVVAGGTAAWLLRGDTQPSATERPSAVAVEQNSIAVLPFVDMSAGRDQEYFSDGISEEILNTLARIPGLRVAARTSSFSFKNKDVNVEDVARQLRVANVLEGSVRRAGERVRISAQLINAANGFEVWSESFDRDLKDIFAVQQEIGQAIASKLRIQLSAEQTQATAAATNQIAYDKYLRGRFFLAKRTPDGLQRARQYFSESINDDPSFAPSYAGLAATLLVLPLYTDVDVTELRPQARTAALRALELDSTLAEGWAALGYIRMSYDHDWDGAATAFEQALRLNPSDPNTRTWYGDYLTGKNELNAAIAQYRRAAELDPLSAIRRISLGWVLSSVRRLDQAAAELQLATELDPSLVDGQTHLSRVRFFQGDHAGGITGLEQAVAQSGRRSAELGYLGYAYAVAGRRTEAEQLLRELNARGGGSIHIAQAFIHVGLGDADAAFNALEQARLAGDMWLTENNPDLIFEPLRRDPRWKQLLNRMSIPVADS